MSTRIHNGYRLSAGTNPFEFTRRVRALIDTIRDDLDADLLAQLFTGAVDTCWLKGEAVPPLFSFTTLSRWEDEQKKLDDEDRRKDPNRFELCLGEDPDTGRLLVRLYTDQAAMIGAFEAMDEVETYSYWNHADEPSGITPEQWDERQAAWDRVMPDYTAPAESMLTFILRSESNPRTLMLCALGGGAEDPVLMKVPGRAERALNITRTRYLRLLVNTHGVGTLAAFKHSLTARMKEELTKIGALIEPELWDIGRELLVDGSGERTSDPEIIAALDEACAALFEAEKEALTR